ncbi:anaphase-promoting complex subunit Hcn1 [Entophlyctis luteolus]|nr:anaphase-promoting complex subunit Hcn1 [Entophlyctis luteolus]
MRTFRCTSIMAHNPLVRRMYQQIENVPDIGNLLSRIIPVAVYFILFLHIQACLLFYCGKVMGFPTWDLQYSHWSVYPGGVGAADVTERYVWMLTQALGNTFQFNYKPETVIEQVLTIIFVILGGLMYAYLVGLVSSAAISFDASGRLYRQKIDELTEYVHWKNINENTKKRLLQYYEFKYRGKYFEERALLNDMNSSLRMELATLNCSSLIEKVPFLKRTAYDGRDNVYIGRIATALNAVYFIPGDYIVTQGEQATEMFFIQMGRVDIIVNGVAVTSFKEGEFFGEVALIANIPRTATVQAATFCQLYSLSAKDFNAIILEFGDIKQRIDAIYEERMAKVRMEQAAAIKKSTSTLDNHQQKVQN